MSLRHLGFVLTFVSALSLTSFAFAANNVSGPHDPGQAEKGEKHEPQAKEPPAREPAPSRDSSQPKESPSHKEPSDESGKGTIG